MDEARTLIDATSLGFRTATFDRILENAPAMFTAVRLRAFLRLLLCADSYNFLEKVANPRQRRIRDRTEQEILSPAPNATAGDEITGFALRLVLTNHPAFPRENGPDPLTKAKAKPALMQQKKTTVKKKAT